MVRFFFSLIILLAVTSFHVHAATAPVHTFNSSKPLTYSLRSDAPDAEKLPGKKASLKQRLRWGVAKLVYKLLPAFEEGVPTAQQIKQGRLSMIFGLSGAFLFLIGLALPPVVLLSLPLGIAALVLGIKSVKGNGNTQGTVGIISGAATIFIWVAIALLLAIFISSGGFWG